VFGHLPNLILARNCFYYLPTLSTSDLLFHHQAKPTQGSNFPAPISQMLSYWLSQRSCSPTKATVFKLHLPHSRPSSPAEHDIEENAEGPWRDGWMSGWLGGWGLGGWVVASQLVAGTIKTVTEAVIVQNVYTQMAALCTFSATSHPREPPSVSKGNIMHCHPLEWRSSWKINNLFVLSFNIVNNARDFQ